MEKNEKQARSTVYVVQSDINRNDIHTFTERPVLCDDMGKVTGSEWVKETLDYHFTKNKETEFSYRGYTIFCRTLKRGESRGRFKKKSE